MRKEKKNVMPVFFYGITPFSPSRPCARVEPVLGKWRWKRQS
jgi:hypothetical protein